MHSAAVSMVEQESQKYDEASLKGPLGIWTVVGRTVVIILAFLRTLHTDFYRGHPGLLSPTVNTSSSFLTPSPVFALLMRAIEMESQ